MYRFRSVKYLIGEDYQELERQQIYFASLDKLNDPLEGTRRYFWQGDKIVWTNFLKHYLLCLERVILLARVSLDNESIQKSDIPIYLSERDIPTQKYKERIRKINEMFFSNNLVQSYLQFITNLPSKVYHDELYVHLKLLFSVALESIFEVDRQSGILPNVENKQSQQSQPIFPLDLANVWEEGVDEHSNWDAMYQEVMTHLYDTLKSLDNDLLLKYQDTPKQQSIYVEFTQLYLDAVVHLTYPNTYVACFMDNCMNPSIWGTYGDSHTGVCLKFNTGSSSTPSLPLKKKVGFNANGFIYEYRSCELHPMTYSSNFEEVDFFRNLGRLPIPQMQEQWYTDENGKMSVCGEAIFQREEEWRKDHWNGFEEAYLTKETAWAHEREYRILLHSALDMFEDPKDRALEYKFENLEAIIFGMKTATEDRAKIIDIVKRKCEASGRNQFDFFEMAYSERKNEWYLRKFRPILGNE